MKTFYVIRSGWNAANQSFWGAVRNPKNRFESRQYKLVGIVEAESEGQAVELADCTCYHNQFVFAVSNPRAVKGLTEEIRKHLSPCE
jgi:hypothetical protein